VEIEAYAKKNNVKVVVHSAEGINTYGREDAAIEKHVALRDNHFYPADSNGEALSLNYSPPGDCFYTAVSDKSPSVTRAELADFIVTYSKYLDVPLVELKERRLVGGNNPMHEQEREDIRTGKDKLATALRTNPTSPPGFVIFNNFEGQLVAIKDGGFYVEYKVGKSRADAAGATDNGRHRAIFGVQHGKHITTYSTWDHYKTFVKK